MTKIIYGLLPLLAAMICLQAPVQAQAIDQTDAISLLPGLDIEARIGLGIPSSSEEPTAFTAFIRNNTNQTIEGRLEISDHWRGSKLNLGEIYLAPGQARRFCAIKNFERWGSPLLAFVSEGKTVWQQPLSWAGYSNNNAQGAHKVGILHDGRTQHQFRIDLPVTSTAIVNMHSRPNGWQNSITVEFTEAGYQVATSNIKTWQVPDHFAPLECLRAIVAIDSVNPDQLNAAQITAIAHWISTGGSLYLHSQATELLEKIEQALPFAISPAVLKNTLFVRRCGLGQIVLYPDSLFGNSTAAAEERIYRSIAALPQSAIQSTVGLEVLNRRRSYGRNATRVAIMGYFFGYLVLCTVPIVFVTTKLKRKVLPYTVGLIGIGCCTAAILGATLRNSTGEARMLTLTVPGENGGIQFADIEVRSTGGIASQVTVTGKQPDLQAESPSPQSYYHYGNHGQWGMTFEAFDWRANEATASNRYQLQAEITPWGTKRLRATDFHPEMTTPDVELKLAGVKRQTMTGAIHIRNTASTTIKNVQLILQVESDSEPIVVDLNDLAANQKTSFPLKIRKNAQSTDLNLGELFSPFRLPTTTTIPNQVRAFLVGTLPESSGLEFSQQESNFELDHDAHLWMYEIPAQQIQTSKK